jgi:hypothetical protein
MIVTSHNSQIHLDLVFLVRDLCCDFPRVRRAFFSVLD